MSNFNSSVKTATKWSSLTEIAAKLVTPISTMVLARVLTPEAFGVMVTATMVISFAEIFTDAGFQKYIVQHDFISKKELYNSVNVAFISNLIMSVIILCIIILFSSEIADLVGNKGYGAVISVSSICIPLAAFSSIQMSLYKRNLDFKTLFTVRMVGLCIPIIVTIPLALIFKSYWALVIGMIALNLSNAIILTLKSDWKPKLWYKWTLFKQMFSFTFISMIEAIMLWLTSYVDIFIVGNLLNDYYLGIYKTSMSSVGQMIGIITSATTPVLFASLSRLQNNDADFKKIFFKYQKIVGLLVIPFGVLIYIFRDFITEIFLGPQWHIAAYFIGLWGISSTLPIVISQYASEVYRAKGCPIFSVITQVSSLLFIVPAVIISIHYGFSTLCLWRSIARFPGIVINLYFLFYLVKYTPKEIFINIFPTCLAASVMFIVSFFIPASTNYLIEVFKLIMYIMIYTCIIYRFPKERKIFLNLKRELTK